ncbi:ribonuclease III [bacterium]|nr:ribonuclease III [bacterium]
MRFENSFVKNIQRFFSKRRDIRRESGNTDSLYHEIGYRFKDPELFRLAMTHRSALGDRMAHFQSNERLEFLGDAVLGMIVTDALYKRYPHRSEGRLTRAKSVLVSREALARHARRLDIGQYLFLGAGEERSGGRNRHSILSNAMEAIIGAVYIDGGVSSAEKLISDHMLEEMDRAASDKFHRNFKSWLLEHAQAHGLRGPEYNVVDESGPDHRKFFRVEVCLDGLSKGVGQGRSKKIAEQDAAKNAINAMGLKK